jgi:hypothetical protein
MCTDAYREALTRDFESTALSALVSTSAPCQPAPATCESRQNDLDPLSVANREDAIRLK